MSYEGKINVYTCTAGHKTITVDLVDGTTPMIIDCQHLSLDTLSRCGKDSRSAWYRCDQDLKPTHEWYKPEKTQKLTRSESEHVNMGGLLLRRIGDNEIKPADIPAIKTGRNTSCPCGSGKKFKHCCLKK